MCQIKMVQPLGDVLAAVDAPIGGSAVPPQPVLRCAIGDDPLLLIILHVCAAVVLEHDVRDVPGEVVAVGGLPEDAEASHHLGLVGWQHPELTL
ncbi:MAG: hypothetical protein E7Z64_07430 [Thermoplasmata archaeon]|nr:hypothetical protein [Thermoplasmata archaeon]